VLALTDRVRLSTVIDMTERIVATPRYIARRQVIERALWSRLSIGASEVERLFA
jgi:hypothetical protein